MAGEPHLSLILPAYNEAGHILATLRDVQGYLDGRPYVYEMLVAADGDDGTRELLAPLAAADRRLVVLGGPGRGGKGRGIRQAVGRARGQVIGFADSDNKTPIEEMDRLLPWLDRGYDLVIGSRRQPDSQVEALQPLYRRLGSWGFAVFMHTLLGMWDIHDTQCGFKFFRGAVARELFGRQRIDGYMFDVEVLYLARKGGYRIKEVGVRWHADIDSRMAIVSSNWQSLRDILRIRFGRYPSPPAPQAAAHERFVA
jgi:dolichyl-phosphate beta-glucosyltransferase